MSPRIRGPLVLLLALGFLAPILGGQIASDQSSLEPSIGAILSAIFGGTDAPVLTHALLISLGLLALIINLVSRRIHQVPNARIAGAMVAFLTLLGFSVLFSEHKAVSFYLVLEWLGYGGALFAVVSATGRRNGPQALLGAIVAGTSWVALKGIREYAEQRGTDPSWRIFAGWVNPNATAAILMIGMFCALGLALYRPRVEGLILTLLAGLIGFAILLTGSKGAIALGLPIGYLVMCLALVRSEKANLALAWFSSLFALAFSAVCFLKGIAWIGTLLPILLGIVLVVRFGPPESRLHYAGRLGSSVLLSAVLATLLAVTTPKPVNAASAVSVIERPSQSAQTQDQSTTFRLNLWKSAASLIKERPVTGYGLGSYRYESAKPGLTTSTVFAHNVYLQIWAEAGFLALATFGLFLGLWLFTVTVQIRKLPMERVAPLAGILGAVFSLLAHSLIDSDLYYCGIGLTLFLLLGVGLLLCADGVAPEYSPRPLRIAAALAASLLLIALAASSYVDLSKGFVRNQIATHPEAAPDTTGLVSIASFDGDAAYLIGRASTSKEQIQWFERALLLEPTPKIARALAQVQERSNQYASATATLHEALLLDPNNLITLNRLMHVLQESGDAAGAVETGRRLMDVEKTPYFTVRSIPESIPTETYLARIEVVAPSESDPLMKADLLADGVRGMLGYADKTWKIVAANAKSSPDPEHFAMPGYDSLSEAKRKLEVAQKAATEAEGLYRKLGKAELADEMAAAGRALATALL